MTKTTNQPKAKGSPVAEAYETYDRTTFIPKRIRAGLVALGKGRYLREQEFMSLCDVRQTADFARFRETFSDYWVQVNRYGAKAPHRLWFGSKEDAAAFRERIS